ncbi:MAG: hypothetical protein DRO05_05030 [Thermoproteota archaeon]|nr:MAG: hypothetical protein DRO05_05030 [Candidatus Korarchaeota archaeon]
MSENTDVTFYDYFAASTLACAFVWIWGIILGKLPELPERTMAMIVVISFFVYVLGGAIASYIIVRRSSGKPLLEGVKVGIGSMLILLLIIFPASAERSLGATLAVMFCTFLGCILGAQVPKLKKLFRIVFGEPPKG